MKLRVLSHGDNAGLPRRCRVTLYALDVERLGLDDGFGAPEAALGAMEGHGLSHTSWVGAHTLSPDLAD